jgi:hypothetical protein
MKKIGTIAFSLMFILALSASAQTPAKQTKSPAKQENVMEKKEAKKATAKTAKKDSVNAKTATAKPAAKVKTQK